MKTLLICLLLFFIGQPSVNAQPATVAEALSNLRKGDAKGLRMDQYTDAEASAVAFLENIGTLEDEKIRMKVVQFSAALMQRPARPGGRQDERNVERFVVHLTKILEEDSSERVRGEAGKSLMETVSPGLLDRHQAALRQAAEKWKDIATLLAYASLPSSDAAWLAGMVRTMKPESRSEKYQLDSILARFGDRAASDRLIEKASNLQGIGTVELGGLIAALAFVPSEGVQKYLGSGLRSEAVVSLTGGGTIPWRNCCARALVRMHRQNESFPVKNEDYFYSDDELDELERWCVANLGISFPGGARKHMVVTPSIVLPEQ